MEETITQTLRVTLGKLMYPEWPAKGMTLRQVGEATGTSAATIQRFLDGKSVDSDTLDEIAKFLEAK